MAATFYQLRPPVVTAIQFDGKVTNDPAMVSRRSDGVAVVTALGIPLNTLDWILTSPDGNIQVVPAADFLTLYEPAVIK